MRRKVGTAAWFAGHGDSANEAAATLRAVDGIWQPPYHAPAEYQVIARVVNKARTFAEAEEWDILQHVRMSPEERREVAKELKRHAYGEKCPDVRDATRP